MVLFQAWHSDKTRDRGYHIMLSTGLATVGYIVLAALATRGDTGGSIGGRYFALFLVVGGLYSLFPLVMSWAANVFSPTSKRGVGTAFIVSISNCVSMCVAPFLSFPFISAARRLAPRGCMLTSDIPAAHVQCVAADLLRLGGQLPEGPRDRCGVSGALRCRTDVEVDLPRSCVFASFLAAFLLRTRLARMNRRNAEAVRAMGAQETKAAGQGRAEEVWDNDPRYVFMT